MSIEWRSLPDLPTGLKNGVGFSIGDTIYCGLGSMGKRWIALNVSDQFANHTRIHHSVESDSDYNGNGDGENWQDKAPFPGCERNDAVVIPTEGGCYVFSGAGCRPEQSPQYATVLTDGYYYDAQLDSWHNVCNETPVGLLGAAGMVLENGQLVFIGGYNKHKFDHLMHALNTEPLVSDGDLKTKCLTEFMSLAIDEYQWNQDIWCFDPETKQWHVVAKNPFLANCGAGVIVKDQTITLIEGEVKPGLRSRQVKSYSFDKGNLTNSNLSNSQELISIYHKDHQHEGLAGAYCTANHGKWFVAGGAYFKGSQDNYQKGQWYSHQGLTKQYDKKVWQFNGNEWTHIGDMASGRAYGVCVTTTKGVIIIGGENEQGTALTQCERWINTPVD